MTGIYRFARLFAFHQVLSNFWMLSLDFLKYMDFGAFFGRHNTFTVGFCFHSFGLTFAQLTMSFMVFLVFSQGTTCSQLVWEKNGKARGKLVKLSLVTKREIDNKFCARLFFICKERLPDSFFVVSSKFFLKVI